METRYPLKFEEIFKEKVWGGRRLEVLLGKALPPDIKIGESWEIADHGEDTTSVRNGSWAGTPLSRLLTEAGDALTGRSAEVFPLLLKFIDADDVLSVQVHPDDAYAAAHEGPRELGKAEAWYIVHAEPEAKIYHGLKPGTTKDEFEARLAEGTVADCLASFEAGAGDVFFIPAGTVHAIGAGIVLAEIQQNSDTTYRVFDWNRVGLDGKPRELHVDRALDVIDFNAPTGPASVRSEGARETLISCEEFVLERLRPTAPVSLDFGGEFAMLCAVSGEGIVAGPDGEEPFAKGESLLLPASMKSCEIRPDGECAVLLAQPPLRTA